MDDPELLFDHVDQNDDGAIAPQEAFDALWCGTQWGVLDLTQDDWPAIKAQYKEIAGKDG